jgi:hypothetical protein
MLVYLDTFDGGDYRELVMPGEAASKPETMEKLEAVFDAQTPSTCSFWDFMAHQDANP